MLSRNLLSVPVPRLRSIAVRRDPRLRGPAACLAILVASGMLTAAPPSSAGDAPFRVLVIDSERADLPLWFEFSSTFTSTLRTGLERPVDIYFEHLDSARLGDGDYLDRAVGWLTEKYGGVHPDIIVIVGPETYRLMAKWPGLMAAETSLVWVAVDRSTLNDVGRLPRSTGLLRNFGQTETVRIALDLLPGTRHLAIVAGPAEPRSYSRHFRSQIFAAFSERLDIIDLSGLPLAEIRARATQLPKDTVLILTAMAVDGEGRQLTHPEVVSEIAPVANAPLFGSIKTELGYGSVGGRLFDPGLSGRETAVLVARIANGETAESIEPRQSESSVVAFDWKELRRWDISPKRLPPGSVIEFKPQSLWDEHKEAVLVAIAIVAFQSVSILALLRSRERRRRTNRDIHRLSGRLITAQEDERGRVARELHDDISQRLALLAIEIESPGVDARLDEVSSKVQDLARDVHAIAHHLRPLHLDGESLVHRIQVFCDEISKRHELRVECRVPDSEVDQLSAEAALALYRVTQEAVQNSVKHSGADELSVDFAVSPRWASVTIADNGRGMIRGRDIDGKGLGFASMRERMRVIGGWLNIETALGEGTTLSAWVPQPPHAKEEASNGPTTHPAR